MLPARLLFSPRAEWPRIRDANRSAAGVFIGWVVPLALLPFGILLLRFTFFASIVGADAGLATARFVLAEAAGQYLALLVWTWVIAITTDRLATSFGGTRSLARAYTVVGYSLTPAFIFSFLAVVPLLWPLALVGAVWAFALLRLGLSPLMGSPEAKRTQYAVTVTAIAVLLAILFMLLSRCAPSFTGEGGGDAAVLGPAPAGKTLPGAKGAGTRSPDERLTAVEKKGAGSLNLDDLQGVSIGELVKNMADPEKMKELADAAKLAANAPPKLPFKKAEPSVLAELLPTTACGLPRVEVRSSVTRLLGEMAVANGEFGGSTGPRVRMEIGDSSTLARSMTQLKKLMPSRDETTPTGYLRFTTDGDRFIDSRWHSGRKEARYVVLISDRFSVSVVATGVESPECAEATARAVDWNRLAAMAAVAEPTR